MGFNLYYGNKLENLAERFASDIYLSGGGDPMTGECVVVQTQGMSAWLKLFLGREGRIAANLETPFLNNFITGVLDKVFPSHFVADSEDFSHGAMVWHLYRVLEDNAERFPELAPYLSGENFELKRWQLAARLAGLFDQYQLYRVRELGEWEVGATLPRFDWQRRLYRQMLGSRHGRDWYLRRFLQLESLPECQLPRRVSVFGVGAMPPIYVDFFFKLAEFIDVHFFYLNPCREYWEHLYSGREARRILEEDELPMEGNPLLAAFGAQGREFLARICDPPTSAEAQQLELFDDFLPAFGGSMLECVQQDILDMRDRAADEGGLVAGDDSIRVHNCHSKRREVEVLHDQLLELLQHESLEPRDIIVMAPDINGYAPYIDAVFSQGALHGFYSISDRGLKESSRIADAFRRILRIGDSRFEASEILALLDVAPLRNRAGIDEDDLPKLTGYLNDGAIRWGYDGSDHERFSGVRFEQFSWEQGIDRLLMGFARIEPEPGAEHGGICGVEAVEGNDALLFGNFIAWVQRLARLRNELQMRRDVRAWVELCRRILDDFFLTDNDSCEEIAQIRGALGTVANHAWRARFRSRLPVELVREILDGELEGASGMYAPFLRGKITFCSLVPMRSIPMPVVAILGLNDGEFPRRDLKLGFNLIAADRKPGDRSRQAEDRYLFLEAILSARSKLLLFYQGQTAKGDDEFPPALPLGELVAYLESCFSFRVTRQKLQPFDFDYFRAEGREQGLFSYSYGDFAAGSALAKSLGATPKETERNLPLNPDLPLPETLELSELIRFWRNPARYYLQNRLGLNFYDNTPVLAEDEEPFALDYQAEYLLKEEIANWTLKDLPDAAQLDLLRGRGALPVGSRGEMEFARLRRMIDAIPERWHSRIRVAERTLIDLECGSCRLVGMVNCMPGGGEQLCWRFASFKHSVAAPALLGHLALNAMYGFVPTSILTLDKGEPIERRIDGMARGEALDRLKRVLEIFREGQGVPQPFFATTSRAYAESGGDPVERLEKAYKRFVNNYPYEADCEDAAVRRCFVAEDFDDEAFCERFIECAELIFAPITVAEEEK